MSGYDVTQHLGYRVEPRGSAASTQGAAAGASACSKIRLRPVGRVPQGATPPLLEKQVAAALHGILVHTGLRLKLSEGSADAAATFLAISECEPIEGGRFETGETAVAVELIPLPTLQKVHILPFEDAKPPNRNLTIVEYVRPFFESNSTELVTNGYEFGHKGRRFQVVGSEPTAPGVVGPDTEIFWEGPTIKRAMLRKVAVLPYAHTLPQGMNVDLFADHVKPYFSQKSSPLRPGDEFTSKRGVRFRVVKCEPVGGGPAEDTEVHTQGPPLYACESKKGASTCGGLATQRCSEAGCSKRLCKDCAAQVTKEGQTRVLCPEHAPASCVLM
eukprot:TRINITY_DN58909_c0_g1_i1.p1 TRINITY_DN58909_c0_g1~~TRINITY_DN58909_c0_g1_i1.p1  ORF type:complete len:330 (-),score=36.07 TRINITY_DN58909_c0_g1_i1:170-1159(-)